MAVYKNIDLDKLEIDSKHIIVENDEYDDIELERKGTSRSIFKNLGLKNAKFKNCWINHTIIEDCYLKKAEFTNVDFTGTKFINCDLKRASFKSCNLRYTSFSKCKLNIPEILGSLPSEPNIKLALLKELRRNENEMGEEKSADFLLIKEIEEERILLKERFLARTSYFRVYENTFSRCGAFIKYILSIINDLIWGHGLKIFRLVRSTISAILFFAIVIFMSNQNYLGITNKEITLNFGQSLYLSLITFGTAGYGPYTPITTISKAIFAIENILGLIFMGLFTAAIYRRISR